MTTSANVRSAWNSAVLQHDTIQAITSKTYLYDITAALKSTTESVLLYEDAKINFFKLLCSSTRDTSSLRGSQGLSRQVFTIEARYYIEKDILDAAQNYNNAIDRIEALDALVISQLGKTWNGTVDFGEMVGILEPTLVDLDGREVWTCGYQYRGTKTI